ncbi:hypothetical protein G6F33_012879 [Rhizopus arrhizus]|nr:hypothetical protein G6F33_012879 [Rhizopus arrhizus]
MRSSVLRRWCDDHGLNILNKTLAYGIPTYLTCRGHAEVSSIIDYYITNMPLVRSASISVALDLSLGSDHKLMSLSFEYSVPVVHSTQSSPPSGQVRRLWNLSRLKEPEVLKLYVSTFGSLSAALLDQLQQLCASPPSTRPPIDHLNDELNAAIYSALDKSVGSRVSRPKQWKKFWTSQLQALADRRDWLYRKWRWSLGIDKAYWWGLHQEAHVRFRTAVKRAKRESWRAFCDSLARGDFSSAVRRVKQVNNRRRPQVAYAHPDGPVAGANAMRDHLASVYSGSGLPSTRPPPLPSSDDHVPFDLASVSEDDPSGSGLGLGLGPGLGSGSG